MLIIFFFRICKLLATRILGIAQSVQRLATCWTVRRSKTFMGTKPTQRLAQEAPDLSRRSVGRYLVLNKHFLLGQRFRLFQIYTSAFHLCLHRRVMGRLSLNYITAEFFLEQATNALRGSRGIAPLFLQARRQMGRWVVNSTPWQFYPRDRPGAHFIGGWVGHSAGLDGCGKSRLHRDSIPRLPSPQRVAIPTELHLILLGRMYIVLGCNIFLLRIQLKSS